MFTDRRGAASICLAAVLWSAGGSAAAQGPPGPREDTQFWNETQLIVPLDEKVDLILIGVLRLGQDVSRPVDERAGGAVAFKPHKYLTIQPTYLYVAQQPSEGQKNFEHRLIFNATAQFPIGRLRMTDRNQIERRLRHGLGDTTFYRNRLQLDYPVSIRGFGFRPFVADEVFYNATQGDWVRNRISAGISKQFRENFVADFFYLLQNDGQARPGNLHVFGTLLRFYLR